MESVRDSLLSQLIAQGRMFWLLVMVGVSGALGLALASGNDLRYADEIDYFALAQHLAAGQGYVNTAGGPTAYRPPGYPYLMTLFATWSHGVLFLKILNVAFLAGAMVVLKHLVATTTPRVAWLAGGALLAYPVWMYTASTLYPQSLCMLLLLTLASLLLRRRAFWMSMIFGGLILGSLILVAPAFQLLAPALGLYVVFCGPFNWRRNILASMVFAAVSALTISPWLLRNHQVFGQFVPVATNGGVNLLLGNSEFTGPNTGVNVDVSHYMAQVKGLNEVESSRKLQQFAVDWVKANPGEAALLYVRKVINYFNYRAELVTASNNAVWKDWLMFFTYYPMLCLVALRLVLIRWVPMTRTELLLGGLYLCNAFLAALFFTRIRFRLPFDGLLMAWAIISIGHLLTLWEGARRRAYPGESHPV